MALYVVKVTETRDYHCVYNVEADSLEEAYSKAEIGDTVSEDSDFNFDVVDRTVDEEPKRMA